mmetsp:Transcript_18379/g.54606  ORF Transcript_18379/g.54606 Transcript_18379/m.54606 type:complete len:216 (+) Transcript_18379:248-895(+)
MAALAATIPPPPPPPFPRARTPFEALISVAALEGDADRGDYADAQRWRHARSNFVSRAASVEGPDNVAIGGDSVVREGARVRGDLARVRLGRYCDVGRNVVLSPPPRADEAGATAYVPMTVGSHATFREHCVVEAAAVGEGCVIGPRAVVGRCAVLKDYCVVAADARVPEDFVAEPFAVITGAPAAAVGLLPLQAGADRRRKAEVAAARRLAGSS